MGLDFRPISIALSYTIWSKVNKNALLFIGKREILREKQIELSKNLLMSDEQYFVSSTKLMFYFHKFFSLDNIVTSHC